MADEPTTTTTEPTKGEPKPAPTTTPKETGLGEGGKKALDDERKARRAAEQQLKEVAGKLKEIEDKDKSDSDKLRDQLATVTQERDQLQTTVLRLEVAADKGVKARWLSGSTREELESAADEYLADHPTAAGTKPAPPDPKPKPNLQGGGDPTKDEEPDGDALAEKILSKRTF